MANIPLQSITFPGLSDKYTTPTVDATLTQTGAAADAKKTGDEISGLKNDFNQFPLGNYPQMGAGYANQLVSGLKKEDSTPHNFRKVPYDATLEDVKKIVGGTVANNQLVDKSKLTSGSSGNHTVTPHDDGSITLVVSGDTSTVVAINLTANSLPSYLKVPNGHKFAVLDSNPQPNGVSYGNNYNGVSIGYNTISDKTSSSGYILLAVRLTNATEGTYTLKPQIIDLTQDFGTSIADYVYNLETATAGAGVAWLKKHFPAQFDAGYQAYDAGTLKSIEGLSGKKTVGFNQFDKNGTVNSGYLNETGEAVTNSSYSYTDYIRVAPNTQYFFKGIGGSNPAICWYDANKNYVGGLKNNEATTRLLTSPESAMYVRASFPNSNLNTFCINLSDPTKNGTYEPYEAHEYALDSDVVLRGISKLDSNNKLYYDGDEYLPDGTVNRRYGIVTFDGTEAWGKEGASWNSNGLNAYYFSINSPEIQAKLDDATIVPNLRCNKFMPASTTTLKASNVTGLIGLVGGSGKGSHIDILHDATDLNSFKAWLASNPITVLYELFTPTTETADPYTTPQIISPDGTEEYIYEDGSFELPVGHSSEYPVNVSGQLDDILDTPSANGTYVLKATVTDGAVTYSWVADA